jgi:tetratricopeptide (TPR) repeat protein
MFYFDHLSPFDQLPPKILIGGYDNCKAKEILLQLPRRSSRVIRILLKSRARRNTQYETTEKEMKADHRHELKTNELAEWLFHLPQWTKENLKTIIFVLVVLVAAVAVYSWRFYSRNVVDVREQIEFTNLLNQLAGGKMQILQAQAQGRDLSFVLLQPAKGLETFAQNTKNDNMAALAMIKRAEALRAELHYGTVDEPYLIEQTTKAKASYAEALEKCSANPSLAAAATFGLGLCEEELGNFEEAKQIYREVAENPDFDGTTAKAAAKQRLDTMDDYTQKLVFKQAPAPPIEIKPADVNLPAGAGLPAGASLPTAVNLPAAPRPPAGVNLPAEFNLPIEIKLGTPSAENIPPVPEANPAPPPNSFPKDPDGNEPAE